MLGTPEVGVNWYDSTNIGINSPMPIPIPLSEAPRIVQAGLSLHGFRKKEQYVMQAVWGVHVYFYEGLLHVGGETFPIAHGSVSLTPPEEKLEWEFPEHAAHYYVHFVPHGELPGQPCSIMHGPLNRIDEVVSDFEFIASTYLTNPLPAQIRFWDFLWRTARRDSEKPHARASALPAKVQLAVSFIAQHLSSRIHIAKLAQQIDVSHNYLTTLFRANFGCTVAAFIRVKRCERAQFLLRNTSLSIKSIAQEVGIPDLNHFNKVIRREFGRSPTSLRGVPQR